MSKRTYLQEQLQTIMGSNRVYYDPPESTAMIYPCIRYSLNKQLFRYANNKKYMNKTAYTITLIDKSSISGEKTCELLNRLDYCSFERTYTADGLHHYIYNIYV
jgi:hypothetical protein